MWIHYLNLLYASVQANFGNTVSGYLESSVAIPEPTTLSVIGLVLVGKKKKQEEEKRIR